MPGLPVVSFKWSDEIVKKAPYLRGQQRLMQTLLRAKGWIVPNYNLPAGLQDVEILRVVVREDMSEDMVDQLVHDILSITDDLCQEGTSAERLSAVTEHQARQPIAKAVQESAGSKTHPHKHKDQRKHAMLPRDVAGAKAGNQGKQC